ncbi:FIST C-terminal domain-containing protein [Cellulophaga baltica]|uniref:FIST signal transduction protein n=1 Tax=Cellulophaga TaxID=104264 RepID=UPI001C07E94F|nr:MULTISPECIES: FIST N-terminal domain-containing protein [Cellulophaga]MBU2996692.1 FIST C-terminal domain-containing protein [Cellulophaga baltica]MDO6768086.1 FIST N-terminal domain-containing protein [Cellulophaga sp. 1_MG-2023]
MKTVQVHKLKGNKWNFISEKQELKDPLVLVFGNRFLLESPTIYNDVKELFPSGNIVFGSTSGEIINENVHDDSIVITAIEFEKSNYIVHSKNITEFDNNSEKVGEALATKFSKENLKHIFIISEGSSVNGSSLIEGLEKNIGTNIKISGGLCGDGARFKKTLASYNESPKEGEIVAIGFYGESLEISCANYGGWKAFGPERIVTKSVGNILYELDHKPALNLYKKYLGDKANELPQAALFYPLNLKVEGSDKSIIRTILNIDEENNTMILAGDVPENASVQLMMSSVDDIAEGASKAATYAMRNRKHKPELSLLVSCIGRKLVMNQRIEEEIEEVIEVTGNQSVTTGFYSYGELAPFSNRNECKLHNQTMTLTLISE